MSKHQNKTTPAVLSGSRRSLLIGAIGGAFAALLAPMARGTETSARALISKSKTLTAYRVFTDEQGKTHLGNKTYQGTLVKPGETSIVPPGCTRFVEGPAASMVIRSFPPKFTTDYHTDPAQQHQMIFTIDGSAFTETKDGGSFHLMPGDLVSVEDSVGEGHKAKDDVGNGFVQLFIARPANI